MSVGNLLDLDSLGILHSSVMLSSAFAVLFAIAGVFDRRIKAVPEWLCMIIALALVTNALLFEDSWIPLCIVVICLLYTFMPKSLETFGQADALIIAHFLTGYTATSQFSFWIVVAGVSWMCCLTVHLIFYRTEDGKRYRPFKGYMIPAIPSYAVSVIIVTVLRFTLTDLLFYGGV